MMIKRGGWIVFLGAILLAACSDKDVLDPTPLGAITPEFEVQVVWNNRYERSHETLSRKRELSGSPHFIVITDTQGHLALYERPKGDRLWKVQYFKPFGTKGLIQGHLYYGSTLEGNAIAVNLNSGDILWEQPLSSAIEAEPAYGSDLLIYHLHDGSVVALDPLQGEIKWFIHNVVPALSLINDAAPLIDKDRVYVGLANGHFMALDIKTGQILWDKPIVLSSEQRSGPPILTILGPLVLDHGVLYTTAFYDRVVALNAQDGRVIWDRAITAATPVFLQDDLLVVVDADSQVHGLNANTGLSLWVQKGLIGRRVNALAIMKNGVLAIDGFGYLHGLSLKDGHFSARYRLPGGVVFSRPLVYEDTLYLLSEDGKMQALMMRPVQ